MPITQGSNTLASACCCGESITGARASDRISAAATEFSRFPRLCDIGALASWRGSRRAAGNASSIRISRISVNGPLLPRPFGWCTVRGLGLEYEPIDSPYSCAAAAVARIRLVTAASALWTASVLPSAPPLLPQLPLMYASRAQKYVVRRKRGNSAFPRRPAQRGIYDPA